MDKNHYLKIRMTIILTFMYIIYKRKVKFSHLVKATSMKHFNVSLLFFSHHVHRQCLLISQGRDDPTFPITFQEFRRTENRTLVLRPDDVLQESRH